ncbi:MAG TPA: hypothetical protein VEZ89_11745, partial [Rubrivivax sp.]|nr:hypothetical protein [Rubrivivax sp.]
MTATRSPPVEEAADPSPAATPTQPQPLNLPNQRHAQRVPLQIDAEAVERIRQSAYLLPQVVKPADYVAEHSPGFESHLDKLGLV